MDETTPTEPSLSPIGRASKLFSQEMGKYFTPPGPDGKRSIVDASVLAESVSLAEQVLKDPTASIEAKILAQTISETGLKVIAKAAATSTPLPQPPV